MEPLQSVPMPTHGVHVALDTGNSWAVAIPGQIVRLAYIATDSAERVSFVSLQSATHAEDVLRVMSRPARLEGMSYGVVIEVHLASDIAEGETIDVALAQAGATTYYPPQQIDDVQ